jgi:hypothetical protein
VFTIVTIIFLPLSFIAAIFTINIQEFPHEVGGTEPSLPLGYVSKFMFGIGFAISIPLIAIAVSVDAIGDFFREVKHRVATRRNRPRPQKTSIYDDKFDIEYTVDTHALDNALSAGRSTARGRRSVESYLAGGSLLPVTSRGTVKRDVLVANGNGSANGEGGGMRRGSEAKRPGLGPVERMSTGFRMRNSGDVERGA